MDAGGAPPWWKTAVFYQIYPRSFALGDPSGRQARLGTAGAPYDALRDGVGDLEGIRRKLDYLADLGIDALWISPFQPSPMADFGYDVADYCGVAAPVRHAGRLRPAPRRHPRPRMRLIMDLVPNHTSDQHPWFVDARSSRSAKHRDCVLVADGPRPAGASHPTTGPGRSARARRGPTTTSTEQWYLHLFLPEQPDLNWSNPAVVQAMTDAVQFWLGRGVDGFRIDVVHGLGKDPALRDVTEERAALPFCQQNDDPSTHGILRELRKAFDAHPHRPVAVGEVFLPSTEQILAYYGANDELPPGIQLSADGVCLRRRLPAPADRRGEQVVRPAGRVAGVGAVEP